MLFGDSITQGAWEPGLDPLGQRLSRESEHDQNPFLGLSGDLAYRCLCEKARCT